MGILLGLGSALAFGAADFAARFASRQIGNFRTLLYMQLIGLIGLSLWLWFIERPQNLDWALIGLTALLGVGNTVAGLSLYRAFQVGTLSVVSPIAASYGAVSLLLALLSGQKPSELQLTGLVVTIAGVVLTSTPLNWPGKAKIESPSRRGLRSKGVGMALLAAGCFGVVFWGLGYVSPGLDEVLTVWEIRLVAPILIIALAGPLKQTVSLPQGSIWGWLMAIGLLDTIAFLCLNYGVRQTDSSIVSVLSSLFSAFTVLLARFFLNEKLAANQWLGVALILLGVGSVSAG